MARSEDTSRDESGQDRADQEGADQEGTGQDGTGEDEDVTRQPRPHSQAELEADREMAEAARAVAQGTAGSEQRERMEAVRDLRTHEERRRGWMSGRETAGDDEPPAAPSATPES